MRKFLKNEKGFTLVELMLVVAVIAILAAVLIPKMANVKNTAREAGVAGNMRTIESYAVSMIDKYPETDDGAEQLKIDLVAKLGELVNPITKVVQKEDGIDDPPEVDTTDGLDSMDDDCDKAVAYTASAVDAVPTTTTDESGATVVTGAWGDDPDKKGCVGLLVYNDDADDGTGVTVLLTAFDGSGNVGTEAAGTQVAITKTSN